MFIPFDRKLDWSHPPLVCLALILINSICYFIWQGGDEAYTEDAMEYYFSSKLPTQELPRYREYLKKTGNYKLARELEDHTEKDEQRGQVRTFFALLADGSFLQQLDDDQIIRKNEPIYPEWKQQRQHFQKILDHVVMYRYGNKPYESSLLTMFTSMFLHGSLDHLIGNMIFLFIFGFVVETVMGHGIFLLAYLIAGFASSVFYSLLEPNSASWGIGASGAISGIVGMYTVLFGLRKVRFFYTLLFYFDYVKAPAIIMLPLWLAYEFYNQFASPSHVNNLAHIGGLLSGALIAYIAKKFQRGINLEYLDEKENEDQFQIKYKAAQQLVAKMEFEEAKTIFEELHKQKPNNVDVQIQLFNLDKLNPATESFHRRARELLSLPGMDRTTVTFQHDVYKSYATVAKPRPNFTPDLLMSLALKFAANDFLQDAEMIAVYFLQKQQNFTKLPEVLLALVLNYSRQQKNEKSQRYLKILQTKFPGSDATRHAQQAFS